MDTTSAQQMQFDARLEDMGGRIKEAWGDLTDDDVKKAEGKWDQMIATIREKTGESLEEVTDKLNGIIDNTKDVS